MSKDGKLCFRNLITLHSDLEYCLISDIVRASILTEEKERETIMA